MLHRLNDEAALWLNNRPNAQSGPQFWPRDGVDRSRDARNLDQPKLGWGLGNYESSWLGLGLVHLPRLPQSLEARGMDLIGILSSISETQTTLFFYFSIAFKLRRLRLFLVRSGLARALFLTQQPHSRLDKLGRRVGISTHSFGRLLNHSFFATLGLQHR